MKPLALSLGALAATATGLVVAASLPQQPAPAQAPTQPQPTAAAPVATAPAAQPASAAQPAFTPEQKAVADAVDQFTKSFGAGDSKAFANYFADDAIMIDPDGVETRGKDAILKLYSDSFQTSTGLKLETSVREVRLITPDVARVEGESRISAAEADASEFTRFSSILVRKGNVWQTVEIRESYASPEDITPYDRLQQLEWMVGDWIDDSAVHKVEAQVYWADNYSYLIRTYKIEVNGEKPTSGTMFIGWDPQCGQIKSWLFDSEGGHGEGIWTRSGENEWVVKANGVLRDGRPTSATQVHTILNKDSVKTDSIDRVIGGLIAEDVTDVVMVRKAAAPGTVPAATSAPANAASPR